MPTTSRAYTSSFKRPRENPWATAAYQNTGLHILFYAALWGAPNNCRYDAGSGKLTKNFEAPAWSGLASHFQRICRRARGVSGGTSGRRCDALAMLPANRISIAKSYVFAAALTALRVWLALQWLKSGLGKITNPAWTDGTGRGLLSFWNNALAPNAHGGSAITYDWYRGFLQLLVDSHAETWFARLIASGETAVGLGLLVGALVPMAALGGLTMNMSYMLAGSASVNPVLALAAGIVLVAGDHASVIGLDGLVGWLLRNRPFSAVRSLGAWPTSPFTARVAVDLDKASTNSLA
jgi:thiosulfate dehydrogenase [quinone] large subunit